MHNFLFVFRNAKPQTGPSRNQVWPPLLTVSPGDTVEVVNHRSLALKITSDAQIFEEMSQPKAGAPWETTTLVQAAEQEKFTVKAFTPISQKYCVVFIPPSPGTPGNPPEKDICKKSVTGEPEAFASGDDPEIQIGGVLKEAK